MSKPVYSFAGIELDTGSRQLRGGGQTRELPPRIFGALEFLVRHAKQVVTKDELADALWPDRVVTEASVSQVIRKTRVELESCGADASLIKTQHGHGYRLDADVSVSTPEDSTSGWQKHPFRTGAVVALLGGVLVTLANVSDLLQWVIPDDSTALLEETQSSLASTDAKVDEVVRLLRDQAARSGNGLSPDSESTIRHAVAAIVNSVDLRKQDALEQLAAGDVDGAAESIVAIASDLDLASAESVVSAAASWQEAGAIYYTSDIHKAVDCFESAYRLSPDDPQIAVQLGFAYVRAGRLDDAGGLFESTSRSDTGSGLQADFLRGAGIVRKLKGDFDGAGDYFTRAAAAADAANDRRRRSQVLLQQGALARSRGDNRDALDLYESAVEYAEELEDRHLLASSLNNLGTALASDGQFERANAALHQSHEIHVARHDLAGQSQAQGNLGAVALLQEDYAAAESHLLESVAVGEKLGWPRSVALDLINLATISASRQEFDVASARLHRALDIARSAELREIHAIILVNLGELARDQGDDALACRRWAEALVPLRDMQHAAADIVVASQEALDCP